MIDAFSVSNFRCFQDLRLKDLRRINVIVGDNGVGKTALGEAIYLAAAAAPAGAWYVRFSRGRVLPQTPQSVIWNREFFRQFWRDLFFNFDDNRPISASLTDSYSGRYAVKIFYDEKRLVPMPVSTNVPTAPIAPLVFERTDAKRKKIYTTLEIDQQGQPHYSGNPELIPLTAAVASTYSANQADMANWYSALSKQNKEAAVVDALRSLFPQVAGVSLELDANVPSLFVQTTHSVLQKQPLAIVSAGIGRTFYILLGIASAAKGVVLVDEIENGVYYKRMPEIWRALLASCERSQAQLITSTHSFGTLQALLPILEEDLDAACLIRLELDKTGKRIAKQFWGSDLKAALQSQGEIR
jgi:AAA15 family ATPase/GTPase